MHIGQNQAYDYRFKMYRLVIASQKGRLIGAYFPDHDSQVFSNLVSPSKAPLMFKGFDQTVESHRDPPYDATANGFLTYNARRFTIGPIDMNFRPDEEISMISVYIKFRIVDFGTSSYGDLLRFYSDRNFVLRIGSAGNLQFLGSNSIKTDYVGPINLGVWYHVVVTLARVDLQPRTMSSFMMLEVYGDGNLAVGKSDFNCKAIF